jgi:V8-like Glu-specific endopeptidase
MKYINTKYCWAIALALLCTVGYAQIPTRKLNPEQFRKIKPVNSKMQVQDIKLSKVEISQLLVEDDAEKELGLPFRFGKDIDVDLGLKNSGQWEDVKGGRIWKIKITSENAYSINLIFDNFRLSNEAELYIYNEDETMIIGPILSKNNNKSEVFATDLIQGQSIILELFEPAFSKGESKLHISKVIHGYVDMFYKSGFGDSGSCNIDVNCSQGNNWHDESDAVAMILLANGTRYCTGSLLNNDCQDFTPNILTAFHCIDGEHNGTLSQAEIDAAESWVFRFNYKSPTCNGGDGYSWYSFSGATLRAAWNQTDFALLEMNQRPQSYTGIKYAGWSTSSTASTSAVSIHHPSGDVMKISIDNQSLTSEGRLGGAGNNYWRVDWDEGTTEGGSSGAPLFDNNQRVIGQLSGGYASCPSTDERDWFGRFDLSWTGGVTDETRLSTWLTNDLTVTQSNTLMSIPLVTGPDPNLICTSSQDFTISNVPAGQTVSWSVSPSNLVYTSTGTGTTASLKAKTTSSSGSATITFTLHNGANCPNGATFTKTFWVGKPIYTELDLITTNSGGSHEIMACDYTSADAQYDGGSGHAIEIDEYDWDIPYASDWDIDEEYGGGGIDMRYIEIDYWEDPPPSTEVIKLRAHNGCGWGSWKSITVDVEDNCGGWYLMFTPNPANGETILSIETSATKETANKSDATETVFDENVEWNIEVYDNFKNSKLIMNKQKGKSMQMETANWENGVYVIRVLYKDRILTGKLLVEK